MKLNYKFTDIRGWAQTRPTGKILRVCDKMNSTRKEAKHAPRTIKDMN